MASAGAAPIRGLPQSAAVCRPGVWPAESAYKCGVQICFTLVLLLVGMDKP